MNKTPSYNFNSPLGSDNFDIEHQNSNWLLLESLLREASIGKIQSIINLSDGRIQINYTDGTYCIYSKYNPDDGTVTKSTYNEAGVNTSTVTEPAGNSNFGVIQLINSVNADKDKKYYELLSYLTSFGVKQDITFTVQPIDFTDYDNRNTVKIKALYSNGEYCIYDIVDGITYETKYNPSNQEIISRHPISFTDNQVHTHVRIAQLEKKINILEKEISKNKFDDNIRDWTLGVGQVVGSGIASTDVVQCTASVSDYLSVATKTYDIDPGTYSLSIRCMTNNKVSRSLIRIIIRGMGGAYQDDFTKYVVISGNEFSVANKFDTFSFIINSLSAKKLQIELQLFPISSGTLPIVQFQDFYINKAVTAFGASAVN